MRRKLAYSNPVLANTIAKLGRLPQGDWHVSKTGGKLFVGNIDWKRYAFLNEMTDEAEFHLDKATSMLVQAQDKTTCMDIAIESKPAYDIFVLGGGASELLHRADRAVRDSGRWCGASRLVLVLNGGWRHETREPMQRSELRAEDTNMGFHGYSCRHTGCQALEIQHPERVVAYSTENVRLSAVGADACKRMDLHNRGELGLALQVVRWSDGRGHIQGESECRRHQGATRSVGGHANRHVLHRVERVADFAGGWRSYLRRRYRPLLALSLGVAA